jgi:TetR/AcrR family transcriptional regulator, regulator of autoinduction and epiphytic fitness
MPGPVKRRSYDNSRRAAGARQTRHSIVVAARDLFVRSGYPATTFPAIADAAGVSVQTVFAHFPAKRDLLKEVIDQAIVGDDEPLAIRDRPEVAAIRAEPDPVRKLRTHAAQVVAISRRATSVDQMLRSAAGVDPEAAELWARGSKARQAGMEEFAAHLFQGGHLREGLSAHQAADRLAVLIDPEVYRLTVGVRGWSPEQHEAWLAEMLIASLLPAAARGGDAGAT